MLIWYTNGRIDNSQTLQGKKMLWARMHWYKSIAICFSTPINFSLTPLLHNSATDYASYFAKVTERVTICCDDFDMCSSFIAKKIILAVQEVERKVIYVILVL